MKINKVETIRSTDRANCWILLHADTGHIGIGETYHRAAPAEQVIHELARAFLLGNDPENIDLIWDNMYKRASFHGLMGAELRAISGIDTGLWDLLGKIHDTPLYRLLGGQTRTRVPIYFSGIYDEVPMGKMPPRTGRNSVSMPAGRPAKQPVFSAISTATPLAI